MIKKTESFIAKCEQSKKFERFAYNCIKRLINGDFGNIDPAIKLRNKEILKRNENLYLFGHYLYKNSCIQIAYINNEDIHIDFRDSNYVKKLSEFSPYFYFIRNIKKSEKKFKKVKRRMPQVGDKVIITDEYGYITITKITKIYKDAFDVDLKTGSFGIKKLIKRKIQHDNYFVEFYSDDRILEIIKNTDQNIFIEKYEGIGE